ncbi:MAG: formylmethanofuran dehydrogenase subunit B [Candidatus Bathyarchaeia archaeon]
MDKKVIENAVCTVCGCCCDHLEVVVEENRIVNVRNACAMSSSKLLGYMNERITKPMMRGKMGLSECTYERAIDATARILARSRSPLLYGWSLTSCEAVEVGVELAEETGGFIDNTTSTCHGPTILGVHEIGESSCTLGEVRHRADLVVYWGSNPVHAHPLHISRYAVTCKGRFRPSRAERRLVVLDVRRTDTAKMADVFIQVRPNEDYELMCALTAAVRGDEIEVEEVAGVPTERIEELAELMINCEFGVLFFGLGLTMSSGKNRNIEAALLLVRELNSRTKFVIMPMRGHFNVNGANNVTTWLTGYPYAVDFTQGYPRYNPGETSAVDLLARNECDSALIVASDPVSNFPRQAVENLTSIPLVTIDPHITPTTLCSDIVLPSTHVGVEVGGTVYRMDGVVLETRPLVKPPRGIKSDVEILRSILRKVKSLRRAGS